MGRGEEEDSISWGKLVTNKLFEVDRWNEERKE